MIVVDLNKKLSKEKGGFELDLKFEAESGQIITIYGPSGSGKTTLLRLISGLENADQGIIKIDGDTWFDAEQKINLPPQNRSIGFVFQDYALFPNMTVRQNLEFGQDKNDSKNNFEELIEIVELSDFLDRKPDSLSGGQKQRVALARALIQKPRILLLDEPFAALDDQIRSKLLEYIKKLHSTYEFTMFLVSHQLSDIFYLSKHIICLKEGKIETSGTIENVFLSDKISGKFSLMGKIISIVKTDILYRVNVLSQNNLFSVMVTEEESNTLNIGDKVMLASKAFNPIILPLEKK